MIDIVNPFADRLETASSLSSSTGSVNGGGERVSESPIWQAHRPDGTLELKFLVHEQKAETIRNWARQRLQPDPHSSAPRDDVSADHYRVQSLYLDTPALDIFHRIPELQGAKYRIRRYGDERIVWLERKQKTEGVVRKQRIATFDDDLAERLFGPACDSWEGGWFRQQIDGLKLIPSCRVTYERFARIGLTPSGPVRLTLDSGLSGEQSTDWTVPRTGLSSAPLLDGRCILELKFRKTVPALFKELMQDLQLATGRFSKYRETVRRYVAPLTPAADRRDEAPDA